MDIESVLLLALNEEVCVQHFALLIFKSSRIFELLNRSIMAKNGFLLPFKILLKQSQLNKIRNTIYRQPVCTKSADFTDHKDTKMNGPGTWNMLFTFLFQVLCCRNSSFLQPLRKRLQTLRWRKHGSYPALGLHWLPELGVHIRQPDNTTSNSKCLICHS